VTRTTESRQLGGPVFIAQVDATSVDIGWVDNGCDGVRYTLTLDETASQLVLTRPVCGGDSSALGRWVRLTFDGPIDAATITATEDGPGASPPG
jgi:hypothetical protein